MAEEPRGTIVREREEEAPEPLPATAVEEREAVREERAYAPARPPERRTSALALASLATGISAYFLFPVIGAIAAIITGFLAQDEIRASNGQLAGAEFATAGLVLGWVQIGLIVLFAILIGVFAVAVPGFRAGLPVSI